MTVFECPHCGRTYDDATTCTSDDCPGALVVPENIDIWSVDSVAECIDGLSHTTYCTLWNDFVPHEMSPDPDAEPPALKDIWSQLNPEIQRDIIAGALRLIEEDKELTE